MHNIIKNNYNYIHIWIQIIHRIRITYFLSHRWVLLSLSFLFLFLVLDIHISILSFLLSFLWFIYSKLFIFYTILTHLEQRLKKKKKKNLDRTQYRKIRQQLKFNLKRVYIYIYIYIISYRVTVELFEIDSMVSSFMLKESFHICLGVFV